MKDKLNWQNQETVNIFEEVTLWSAPFGRMLLENIPMEAKAKILDLGFGTGFPLIELSQRFGASSFIYGMDIWEAGIARAKKRIKLLEIENIKIFEQSASIIPLGDEHIDLICSNLGVNNFEEKDKVFQECFRVLKNGGKLCLTTNPIGTFSALFELFVEILEAEEWNTTACQAYINHRGTQATIIKEIEQFGFKLVKTTSDLTNMRFVDALAVLNHSLMRTAFIASWEELVLLSNRKDFFEKLRQKIDQIIQTHGVFELSIPMLYLEFEKSTDF